ncbi:MAG: hypothetical protein D6808_03995 [Candidatus Dadabacteria bacterium]|nr:MAG: hypothetical protein D6808_03995 [Candidatus Dadabacteria bacterium]
MHASSHPGNMGGRSVGEKGSKTPLNSSFLKAVQSYIEYYADGSTHTARAKRLDLNHFVEFLTRYKGVSTPQKLKLRDWDFSSVQSFVDERLRLGEAPATVARRLATIKHMGRTLSERIKGFVNPAKEVKNPKVSLLKPKALTEDEVAQVKKIAEQRRKERDSFIRFRNETIFGLLIDTGLRADEVRLLRMGQLSSECEWIRNVRTKGRRYRNVYITSEFRPRMCEYLKRREAELKRFFPKLTKAIDRTLPVFISTYGASAENVDSFFMGAKTLWRAINELSSGVSLHPHLLRHSFAVSLLESCKDIRLVAQALGHGDVRTTMRYTERSDEELAKVLEKSRTSRNVK